MKKIKGMKYYFIVAAIALLAVFMAAPAEARDLNWMVRGDYNYNLAANCTEAPCLCADGVTYNCVDCPVFDPDTFALRVPDSQRSTSYNIAALIHFDGHGVFTLNGKGLSLVYPYPIPVFPFNLDCGGTYKVDSEDNELFVEITFNDCISTVTSGAFSGYKQELFGLITGRGRLDTATGIISVNISNKGPEIEEWRALSLPNKSQRICNFTGSMVKLLPRKH